MSRSSKTVLTMTTYRGDTRSNFFSHGVNHDFFVCLVIAQNPPRSIFGENWRNDVLLPSRTFLNPPAPPKATGKPTFRD